MDANGRASYTGERAGARHAATPDAGRGAARDRGVTTDTGWDTVDWSTAESWQARSRIVLTPIAAPSILGLFGFAGATFMVASYFANWWGGPTGTVLPILAPFALFFGGLAQGIAGIVAYRARDAVATAAHGTWGAFWLAFGTIVFMISAGLIPATALTSQAFGFWWIVLALVTMFCAFGALRNNVGLTIVLAALSAGSALFAVALLAQLGTTSAVMIAGGWVLVVSAAAAFYTAGAMLLEEAWGGRVILPLGRYSVRGNLPSQKVTYPVEYEAGMPGAKVGQ